MTSPEKQTQIQGTGRVIGIEESLPGYFEMRLEAPWIAVEARPAQFVHISVSDLYHPLLRRPISIYDTDGASRIRLLWRVEGEGTALLSRKVAGDSLDILGPRGRAFGVPDPNWRGTVLLAGGGIGIPPIFFLSKVLGEKKVPHRVFLGAQSREHLPTLDRFEALERPVTIVTDDGSAGENGLVTQPLWNALEEAGDTPVRIYACGPTSMLQAIAKKVSPLKNVEAELSLEARMSCALGACMGCVVNTIRGYERVCTEGPVFDARDLVW